MISMSVKCVTFVVQNEFLLTLLSGNLQAIENRFCRSTRCSDKKNVDDACGLPKSGATYNMENYANDNAETHAQCLLIVVTFKWTAVYGLC